MTDTIAAEYAELLQQFLVGKLTPPQFQKEFLRTVKNETRPMNPALSETLNALFADVDSFCDNDVLRSALDKERPGWYLDRRTLQERVRTALDELSHQV